MLNDIECEEIMDAMVTCLPDDSVILRHLTQLHQERDVHFYWSLRELAYWARDDKTHNLILRMH